MNRVIVKVVGLQKDMFGEENRIEMVSVGKHYEKNGVNYIVYEDSEASGLLGTKTLLKVGEDSVTLVRRGSLMQEQYFAKDELSSGEYRTPFGRMKLAVFTNKLEIDYGSVSGRINIEYVLSINGKWQSDNELQIDICADHGAAASMH